jgi:integrase
MPAYESTSLSVAVQQYQRHLESSRKSASYVYSVGVTGRQLMKIIGDKKMHNISADDISHYKTAQSHCSDRTLNVKLVHLRGLCAWARDMRRCPATWNPMAPHRSVTRPRTDEAVRIARSDWDTVLDACPHPVARAMTAVGLYCLTRASELVLTTPDAVPPTIQSWDGDWLTIWRTKTRQWDTLPVPLELQSEMHRYLDWYRDEYGKVQKSWYLFPTSQWEYQSGMQRDSNGRIMSGRRMFHPTQPMKGTEFAPKAIRAAGYTHGHHVGFHTFRRSGARALYDELRDAGRDGSLRIVQTLLGHKSIEMTEVYIGVSADRELRNKLIAGRFMYGDSATKNEVRHLSDYRHRKNDDDDGQAPVGAVVR